MSMEFIDTAILIAVMWLVLTFVTLCAMLVVIGMCLPFLGLPGLPGVPDYDEDNRWLRG